MKKLKNKKGFTLMEMLIVVAIIVILVAIAIPTFSGALTKAKVATDEANVRAWYAEQMAAYLLDETATFPGTVADVDVDLQAGVVNFVAGDDDTAPQLLYDPDGDKYPVVYWDLPLGVTVTPAT